MEEWVCSADPIKGWKEWKEFFEVLLSFIPNQTLPYLNSHTYTQTQVPDHGRTAWMHNKTKATQWDRPQYSDPTATRVMIRWKLGSQASLWLAFVAKVGGGLHRIYCDIAAVKSRLRRTCVELLIKLRCVLLSGYLIKSTDRHNADAVSSIIAAFGRLLAYRSKLEQLTVTNESSEENEDMKVIEQVAVVLSAEGTSPKINKVAQRPGWELEGGKVSQGAFQLLTRDQEALANAFRSSTGT